VERYSGEGRPERYAELARDVVNTHPDLILAVGGRLSLDFKMATTTVPIVAIIVDPIALGLVASIARPGGNITGVAIAAGLEIIGKRMGYWSRRCQNCPPSVTLHRDHTGKMIQGVR
jgi:putative ABC transport system substrate-binding protein